MDSIGTLHPPHFGHGSLSPSACTFGSQERRLCRTSCHHQRQQRQDSEQLLGLGDLWPCQVSYHSLIQYLGLNIQPN